MRTRRENTMALDEYSKDDILEFISEMRDYTVNRECCKLYLNDKICKTDLREAISDRHYANELIYEHECYDNDAFMDWWSVKCYQSSEYRSGAIGYGKGE